jgi:YD repeat-containing protein
LASALAELEKAIADQNEQVTRLVDVLARVGGSAAIETKLVDVERTVRELTAKRDETALALDAAKGAVTPAEHLERVREVRGALDDPDPETRRAARLRVHNAIVALGCTVVCADNPEEGRLIGLFLPGGVLGCIFDTQGRLVAHFDAIEFLGHMRPDADDAELAELARRNLTEFRQDGDAWRQSPPTNRGWLTAYVDRYGKKS